MPFQDTAERPCFSTSSAAPATCRARDANPVAIFHQPHVEVRGVRGLARKFFPQISFIDQRTCRKRRQEHDAHGDVPLAAHAPRKVRSFAEMQLTESLSPAAGEARKTTPMAMSHLRPMRPRGISRAAAAYFSSSVAPGISLDMPADSGDVLMFHVHHDMSGCGRIHLLFRAPLGHTCGSVIRWSKDAGRLQ